MGGVSGLERQTGIEGGELEVNRASGSLPSVSRGYETGIQGFWPSTTRSGRIQPATHQLTP